MWLMAWALLSGCDEDGRRRGPETTAEGAARACEAVVDVEADPLRLDDSRHVRHQGGKAAHFVDMLLDEEGELAVGVSNRALVTFDVRDGRLWELGQLATGGGTAGSWTSADEVAVSDRDKGIRIIDLRRRDRPQLRRRIELPGIADVVQVGDHLFAVTHTGELHVFARPDFVPVTTLTGLGHPWKVVADGPTLLVADNTQGLVPVDVSDPARPVIGVALPTGGSAQDVARDGSLTAVAAGAAGVELFDTSQPMAPVRLGVLDPPGSVVSVSVDRGLLWAATHEGVAVADVSDPAAPVLLDAVETEEFAMAVASVGPRAVVGDWSTMLTFTIDEVVRAPSIVTDPAELVFAAGADARVLTVVNTGAAPLVIDDVWLDDDRFTVEVPAAPVDPGDVAEIRVSRVEAVDATDAPLDASLCLASDDPGRPVVRVPVTSTSSQVSSLAVGQQAVDFVLPDLDGVTHRLSDHLGHPVVLVYFATW